MRLRPPSRAVSDHTGRGGPEATTASIGPHRVLHLEDVAGGSGEADGAPTVVLEAGAASTRSIWALVRQGLAGHVRSVAYDRAGLGRSPAAAGPRRLEQLADDLNALLDTLEVTIPGGASPGFVLVGHSWGGPIVRLAAAHRPERIRGLVLLDPADELCEYYFTAGFSRMNRIQGVLFPPLACLGVLGPMYARTVPMLPERARRDSRAEMYTPKAVRTQIAESADMAGDLVELRDLVAAYDGPAVPVTVVSGASSAGVGASLRAQLNEAHRRRAERGDPGRFVLAESSGHLVMLTQPELVCAEILRVARLQRR
ncbi:alpha/beta hydrolase [Brachybacterium endophyticum]|uniref:Alpha/beta hydrolase n=1 Tax=Brachybacterium endophyticum TaxID=2182385 RepID=A0A2U2RHL8_9MICO|nr:alpha/beta hydrolase [Brachybacterium endophyticum]PWH05363.1 alpha/beta hydrolase [Brachybacterium endophyticum]